jgi:hypothetical protein
LREFVMTATLKWLGLHLRLLFLLRYSIIAASFPLLFVLLAWEIEPQLFRGLLVLDTPFQLFNVTWLSLLLAILVTVMLRVVQVNAPDRFADYSGAGGKPPAPGPWRLRWLLLAGIGLPIPVACILSIQDDPGQRWLYWCWGSGYYVWVLATGVTVLGGLVAFLLLLLFTAGQQLFLHPCVAIENLLPFESWALFRPLKKHPVPVLYRLGDLLARWAQRLGPGYARPLLDPATNQAVHDPKTNQPLLVLAPGHAQIGLWLGGTLVAYLLTALLGYWMIFSFPERSPFGALFYLLLAVLLVGSLLGGLQFLLDYYRIPVLLSLVLFSLALAYVQSTDHYFELNPDHIALSPEETQVDFRQALKDHKFYGMIPGTDTEASPSNGEGTLVVVTAAGGGIQAAAWTAKVLGGLDERYGPKFTRSLGLISAVSGGSVATMYYVENGRWENGWPECGQPFTCEARQLMQQQSSHSSLEATGWGVAYPELLRTFVPGVGLTPTDRGWALEESWRGQLSPKNPHLGDWIKPTMEGKMPVVVFNATVVETGDRLLISPVHGPRRAAGDQHEAQDFFYVYAKDKPNPRVPTAVRLSATFPYVSPVCRATSPEKGLSEEPSGEPPPEEKGYKRHYHVADGGYSENEGALTAIEWIDSLLKSYQDIGEKEKPPFERVLVIRIQPFPPDEASKPIGRLAGFYEISGPITTIQNVRIASQAERDSFDFRLLVEAYQTKSPQENEDARKKRNEALAGAVKVETEGATRYRGMARNRAQWQAAEQMQEQANREGERLVQIAATENRTLLSKAKITQVTIRFPPQKDLPGTDLTPPLSWKLTQKQVQAIDKAWVHVVQASEVWDKSNVLDEPPLRTIDRFFKPVNNSKP